MKAEEVSGLLELASLYDSIEPNTAIVIRVLLGEVQRLETIEAELRAQLDQRPVDLKDGAA